MGIHENLDGLRHPRAAELLACVKNLPDNTNRQLTRRRTLTVLSLHLQYGRDFLTYLPWNDRQSFCTAQSTFRRGKFSAGLTCYWAKLNEIVAGDAPQPVSGDLPLEIQELEEQIQTKVDAFRLNDLTNLPMPKEPEQPGMNLSDEQREALLALKTDKVFCVAGRDEAESVWDYWMAQARLVLACRFRLVAGVGKTRPYELEKRFLAMQEDLMKSRALTRRQVTIVRYVLPDARQLNFI